MDKKSLRLTHGTQRLLMPEEAVRDNSPRRDDVPPPYSRRKRGKNTTPGTAVWDSSRYRAAAPEYRNALGGGGGMHFRATSRWTLSTCPWSTRGGKRYWTRRHCKRRCETCQARGRFSTEPSEPGKRTPLVTDTKPGNRSRCWEQDDS